MYAITCKGFSYFWHFVGVNPPSPTRGQCQYCDALTFGIFGTITCWENKRIADDFRRHGAIILTNWGLSQYKDGVLAI